MALLDAAPDPAAGGNSALSGGRMHVAHAELHAEPDEIRRRILGRAHGEVRMELVDAIADAAGPAATWLSAQGVSLGGDAPGGVGSILLPERPLTHGDAWRDRGPHLALGVLQSRARERGVDVLAGTSADELLHDADGAVAGVVTDGRATLRASSVVLADGGFHADAGLVRRHLCDRPDRLFGRGASTCRGAGLRMAEAAGADLVNLEWLYGHLLHADAFHNARLSAYPVLDPVLALGGIHVGADGRRVVDEGLRGPYAVNVVARLADPLSTWVVVDAARWEDPTGQSVEGMQPFKPAFEGRGARIERGEDPAALARAAGLDPAGLRETIEGYNRAVDDGAADRLPVPRTGAAHPLRGPLVALPLAVGLSYTLGGPATDRDGRVLRDGAPLPGLFAAGGCAANASGGYYGGLATALTMGWRTGQALGAARLTARTRGRR